MRVSEINIYPIKSLGGISVSESIIDDRGFRDDRRFMLVDENNDLLTQRDVSKLATFGVELTADSLLITEEAAGKLEISRSFQSAEKTEVRVWDSFCDALVAEGSINQWFSDILEKDCRLVQMPESTNRQINQLFNKGNEVVSFADGYPYLLIGEDSLIELNTRLDSKILMNRFRPNIVVSGSKAFAEDGWKKIRIGNTVFRSTKPCARCVVTTIDQSSGVSDVSEPLRTLATYRKSSDVFPETFGDYGLGKNDVLFGQNLVAENFGEVIKIGDEIEIID